MAGLVKKSVSKATGGDSIDSKEVREEAEKYRLRVTAGPAYDTKSHRPVFVNTNTPTVIENKFIRAKIKVRIRGYEGLPTGSKSHSPYFDDPIHEKDQYSLAFSFVPKKDLPCEGSVWGNDFDHPVRDRLPPGFNTAFKIVKEFIDPGLTCDAYADEPWLYGNALSCWFAFRIGEQVGADEDFPAPDERNVMQDGADGSGKQLREKLGLPENNEKRRKFFLDKHNREAFTFAKGRCYQGDFYNPYIDFSKFALKLPGFSLGVLKYIDDKSHQLRYVFKNQKSGEVYLNVNFTLLFGQQLKNALAEEEAEDTAVNGKQEGEVEAKVVDGRDGGSPHEQTADSEARATSQAHDDKDTLKPAHRAPSDEPQRAESKQTPNGSLDGAPSPPRETEQVRHASEVQQTSAPAPQQPEERRNTTQVSEISSLLADTSTTDKRGSEPFLFSGSNQRAPDGPVKDMLQETASKDKRHSNAFLLERTDKGDDA